MKHSTKTDIYRPVESRPKIKMIAAHAAMQATYNI